MGDRSLLARALLLPRDADGPQLVQLSLERENAPGEGVLFLSFSFSKDADECPRSNWLHLFLAAAQQDREACLRWGLERAISLAKRMMSVALSAILSLLRYLANRERLDHEGSTRRVSATACDAIPQRYTAAIRIWAWINVGRYHCRDPGAYPDYATASSHAATTGNVLTQQVHILHLFGEPVLTNLVNNRKLSGGFLLASRLRATVDCKKLWDGVIENYKFSTDL